MKLKNHLWVVSSLQTQLSEPHFCLYSSSASDKCLWLHLDSSLLFFWPGTLALWKTACWTQSALITWTTSKRNISMSWLGPGCQQQPHQPQTPNQCHPQCDWLETESAALCISSINLALSILQWRTLVKAQRIERDWWKQSRKAFHMLLLSVCV